MENIIYVITSYLSDSIKLATILGPMGFVGLAFMYFFKDGKLTVTQTISSMVSPVIISIAAIFVSSKFVILTVDSSHGDGLDGFIPAIFITTILFITGLFLVYKRVFHLKTKQNLLSVFTLLLTGILLFMFLG